MSPPSSLSPRPQDLPVQVDSKAKKASIGVENPFPHVLLLGEALDFKFFIQEKLILGIQLVPPRSMFLGGSK